MELKMRNLSLRIKCSFSKINSVFFCPALVKVVLKNFKRMVLVHRFDGFFKKFLLNWFKNLRAQFGLYQKKGRGPDPLDPPTKCAPVFSLFIIINTKETSTSTLRLLNNYFFAYIYQK